MPRAVVYLALGIGCLTFAPQMSDVDVCKRVVVIGDRSAKSPACRRLELRLEALQRHLRTGYREPRGSRLRAQRRSLRARYHAQCMS